MSENLWVYENGARKAGYSMIAGIDEAGRGPLAGPVVSAAVILPFSLQVAGVDDSKKLTPSKRNFLYHQIQKEAVSIGIGIVGPETIDRINILQASLHAMALAVTRLNHPPDYLLIDGIFEIECNLPQEAIPKGDSKSISVAAASIVAKVTRDRIMEKYHRQYPQYGFDRHKGYPTKAHKEALRRFGCCTIHRRTFKGVQGLTPA